MEQWARMKSFTLAAFLLSIASCSTAPTLRLDPGLVRPWSQDAWRDEPYRHPYLAVFKKGDLVLTYLATAHENQASSPTIRLLDQTFANGSFQAVMIEGLPFDSSRSEYEAYLRHVVRTSTGGFFQGGEDAAAAILAHSKGIPFYGGEPTDPEVLRDVLARGYTARDLVGLYAVRMIPVWAGKGRLKDSSLGKLAEDALGLSCRNYRLTPAECPSFDEVKRWYRAKNGKDFGESFDQEELTPYPGGTYFTQRLTAAITDVRNKAAVRHAEELLRKHRRLLVVYGGSHLFMQSKAFEKALGAPVYSQ